jgi:TPR repeat protein
MSRFPIKIVISCLAAACLVFVAIMIFGSIGSKDEAQAETAAAAPAPAGVALVAAQAAAAPAAEAAAPAAEAAAAPADEAAAQAPQQVTLTFEQLIEVLQAEADKNNPRAMLALGNIWENGINSQNINYGKALEWYQKAANLDATEGYFRLGLCYEIGMGTTPDFPKAMLNYQKASEKGFPLADFKLAVLYMGGSTELPADVDLGLKYLNAAAEQGLTVAQKELGALFYYGRLNVARDLTKAIAFFAQAAEAGDAESMKNIGAMTVIGEGTSANKAEGLKWYLLAQLFGYDNDEMRTTIGNIKSDMRAEDIAKAEADSQAWADNFRAQQEARAQAAQAAQAAAAAPAAPPAN